MPKAILSQWMVDRINGAWMDRLWPGGWEIEKDPHPTAFDCSINQLPPHTPTLISKPSLAYANALYNAPI